MFFCVAADYALMQAHFIAAIQILVYAGAIMVLFVFVIMLLNADIKSLDFGKNRSFQIVASVLCFALASIIIYAVRSGGFSELQGELTPEAIANSGGNVQVVSTVLFSDYVLPFELTSILLLVGIVGSVALAKRKSER